jgi:hypothetical protein
VAALFMTLMLGFILNSASQKFFDYGRGTSPRAIDSSHLRQIGQASLIFASDNHDQFPVATDLSDYARQLAIGGGLNDATIWVQAGTSIPTRVGTVLLESNVPLSKRPVDPAFAKVPHLFTVPLNGITSNLPPTTPIGWTRGLDLETGHWRTDSPYGGHGGHIVFLNGNVQFYRNLDTDGGELRRFSDGKPTASLREALPSYTRVSEPPQPPLPRDLFGRIGLWTKSILPQLPELVRSAIIPVCVGWMLVLFPTLTLLLHRPSTPKTFKVPRVLKVGLIATPLTLLILSAFFQV